MGYANREGEVERLLELAFGTELPRNALPVEQAHGSPTLYERLQLDRGFRRAVTAYLSRVWARAICNGSRPVEERSGAHRRPRQGEPIVEQGGAPRH